MPDLRTIDLNLLVHLDALLECRSVTAAARRVHLSQSAMSGSLARLRKLFDDPLMVRNGRTLALTARAEALSEPLRDILGRVRTVLDGPAPFVPATARRTFSISASDYATATLVAPLIRELSVEAPYVTIDSRPRSCAVTTLLREDRVDFAIEPTALMGDVPMPNATLFRDRWQCILDADLHRRLGGGRLDLERFLSLPHVVYTIGPDMQFNLADRYLSEMGLHRRIEATIESFLLAPLLVRGTDLVSLVLERSASLHPLPGVVLVDPPVPLPDVQEAVYWNPRHDEDVGHRWLRDRMTETAGRLTAQDTG